MTKSPRIVLLLEAKGFFKIYLQVVLTSRGGVLGAPQKPPQGSPIN